MHSTIFPFPIDIDQPVVSSFNNFPREYENVSMSCTSHANPIILDTDWKWMFNGRYIGTGPDLVVQNVTKESSGIYSCYASNIAGTKSTAAEMNVLCMFLFKISLHNTFFLFCARILFLSFTHHLFSLKATIFTSPYSP